jgi:hypothetical protein
VHMVRDVSIWDLRDSTSKVVSGIRPHVERRDTWVSSSELRQIVDEAPADPGLLDDLADVRGAEFED